MRSGISELSRHDINQARGARDRDSRSLWPPVRCTGTFTKIGVGISRPKVQPPSQDVYVWDTMTGKDFYAFLSSESVSLAFIFVGLGLYLFHSAMMAALFRKAGKAAWVAWIPFYNFYVFLELGGLPGWILVLQVIPLVGPIAVYVQLVIAARNIGRALGKSSGWWSVLFAVGELIWLSIVALDRSKWTRRGAVDLSGGS